MKASDGPAGRSLALGTIVLMSSLAALPNCGGGTTSPTGAGPSAPDYTGSWRGTTGNVDQSTGAPNPIVFGVEGGQITTMTVHVDINVPPDSVNLPPGGRRTFCTYVFASTAAAPITGNSFTVPVGSTSGPFSFQTTVTGTFESATSARGSISSVPVSAISCRGTTGFYAPAARDFQPDWTAGKQ